jgi:hypothetical protein
VTDETTSSTRCRGRSVLRATGWSTVAFVRVFRRSFDLDSTNLSICSKLEPEVGLEPTTYRLQSIRSPQPVASTSNNARGAAVQRRRWTPQSPPFRTIFDPTGEIVLGLSPHGVLRAPSDSLVRGVTDTHHRTTSDKRLPLVAAERVRSDVELGHTTQVRPDPVTALDRPVYGMSQAARLLGLRADGLRRWINASGCATPCHP